MRIRSIKPEFWRSDDITQLPRELRLLFIGLWSYVDDNGVGVDDYRQIAADLFALDEDLGEVREFIREGLARLSRGSLITRYQVGGKSYLHVTTWARHQKVDKPNKARYPSPSQASDQGFPRSSRDSREACGQGSEGVGDVSPGSGTPDGGDSLLTHPHGGDEQASDQGFPRLSRDSRESLAPGTEEQRNRGTEETPSLREGGPGGDASSEPPDTAGPNASRKRSATARATRLPEDWWPGDHLRAWFGDNCPQLAAVEGRAKRETENFRDYWHGKAGRDATKLDWDATWRKWMRKADDNFGNWGRGLRPAGGERPSASRAAGEQAQSLRRRPREGPSGLPAASPASPPPTAHDRAAQGQLATIWSVS